ncbi:MAG: hypothetical protein GY926_21770 [bacterium]|nr:hypothetical protein [bacterium]
MSVLLVIVIGGIAIGSMHLRRYLRERPDNLWALVNTQIGSDLRLREGANFIPVTYRQAMRRRVGVIELRPESFVLYREGQATRLPGLHCGDWTVLEASRRIEFAPGRFWKAEKIPALEVPPTMMERLPEDLRYRSAARRGFIVRRRAIRRVE